MEMDWHPFSLSSEWLTAYHEEHWASTLFLTAYPFSPSPSPSLSPGWRAAFHAEHGAWVESLCCSPFHTWRVWEAPHHACPPVLSTGTVSLFPKTSCPGHPLGQSLCAACSERCLQRMQERHRISPGLHWLRVAHRCLGWTQPASRTDSGEIRKIDESRSENNNWELYST